jgi:hypothetical protein
MRLAQIRAGKYSPETCIILFVVGKTGLRGPPGQDGRPGAPSIVAYAPFRNSSSTALIDTNDVLVPPSIAGKSYMPRGHSCNLFMHGY